jgi:AAA family ATP:ADP antiporter
MNEERLSARIHRGEWPLVGLMFAYFFAVITTFWILKPLKKGLFVGFYETTGRTFNLLGWQLSGPQAELIAKIGNLLAVFVAVIVFTWLARRLRRQQLTYVFAAFCLFAFLMYRALLPTAGELTVWTFYIFGDLFNSLMVATFFAFLNDSFSPLEARRLYGPIILGGVTGGAVGSIFVRAELEKFSNSTWMFICAAATIFVVVVAALAGRLVAEKCRTRGTGEQAEAPEPSRGSVALEGARLVFGSRYLLAIVSLVGLYELVSTLLDYQFTTTVVHFVVGDPTKHFSTVYAITNSVAFLVQLVLTANIMSRFGVKAALTVMPVLILGASGLFLMVPILWIGSSLNTVDNALNYSINQSAREALYTPLTRDEKYKAKAFIDMFLYRAAKVVAVGLALLVGAFFDEFTAVRWLSFATIMLACVWIAAAGFAGTEFRKLSLGRRDCGEP